MADPFAPVVDPLDDPRHDRPTPVELDFYFYLTDPPRDAP